MDKQVLHDYVDACELIKETEADIKKLKRKKQILHDFVKGSMPGFPFTEQKIHIFGTGEESEDISELDYNYNLLLLKQRKANAERLRLSVEVFMNTCPMRMQRIIRYKFLQKLSWDQIAAKMGNGATAESLRKEFERFMQKDKTLSAMSQKNMI